MSDSRKSQRQDPQVLLSARFTLPGQNENQNSIKKVKEDFGARLGKHSLEESKASPRRGPHLKQAPVKQANGSSSIHSQESLSTSAERTPDTEDFVRRKNSWLFSPYDITVCTPSVKAKDVTAEQELVQRAKGVNFIVQVGTQLKVPQMTINAAATFLHRFYMRFSLKNYHYYDIGGTAVFLACKVEESNRRLRDVVVACTKVATKNSQLVVDEQSKDFWRWRDTIMYNEEVLLEALCFDLSLESPYQLINSLAEKFHMNKVDVFCRYAWGFVNDSCRTPLCLCFPTRVIAAAAFYWSSLYSKVTIVGSSSKRSWYEEIGMTENELIDVCNYMTDTSATLRSLMPGLENTLKYTNITARGIKHRDDDSDDREHKSVRVE